MLEDFQLAVSQFMGDYGVAGKVVKQSQQSYDPSTGNVISTTIEIPVNVILMDLTLQSNGYSVKYGTLVQEGDKEAYVEAPAFGLTIAPLVDKIVIGSTSYTIVTFKETNPTGGKAVAYFLYLRR